MLLKTLVKISSVNNLSDARYCAGMGVAMMGFPLDTDHRHNLSHEQFKALTQWIRGVALIGELSTDDPAVIQQTLDQYAVDYLQLNAPIATHSIASMAIPLFIKLRLQGNETLSSLHASMSTYAPYSKYFLLEAASSDEATLANLRPAGGRRARGGPGRRGGH